MAQCINCTRQAIEGDDFCQICLDRVDTMVDNTVPHDDRQVEMKTNTSVFMASPGSTGDLLKKGTVADQLDDEGAGNYWSVVIIISMVLILMLVLFL
ncbi:MAG: hypothetical protein ACXAE3_04605 [Candidatus Kariarchaeaceae archaeon]|jgi:hypothetical protein